jgi:23S rRNA (guanosine2251-2'-O)-methyltransferase
MIVFGKQPVLYLLENRKEAIKEIFLSKEIDRDIFKKMGNIKISRVDTKKAQALARGGNHQGFIAEIEDIELISYREVLKGDFILLLHSLTDIGNIGAIVRTAYSLGVDGIIVSGINNLKLDGVVRSSSGAVFDTKIAHYKNIYDILNEAKQLGFSIFGATINGKDVRKIEFPEKKILIFGNEADGIPNRVLKSIDDEVAVAMEREFDSLNVSVASAILIDRMRK